MSRSLALSPVRPLGLARGLGAAALVLGALLALALGVERAWLAAVQPLWFDEAWALAVARAPGWGEVLHQARVDVNAPAYYLLLHAWTVVAGSSDVALRIPGLLGVLTAAVLPLARRIEGLSLESRLAWAAAIFAWWGVDIFLAGRCYGLLLALATAQCIAYAGLLRAPSTRRAVGWAALGALSILTHYYALIPTGVQGVVYVLVHRRAALRTWPAALAFVPAFAWLAWHSPRLAAFGDAAVAWHPTLGLADALHLAAFVINPSSPELGLLLLAVLLVAFLLNRGREGEAPNWLWTTAGASATALAIAIGTGLLHPSLTGRYLIPVAPGLLLGLALAAQGSVRPRLAAAVLALASLALAVRPAVFAQGLESRAAYGFEDASGILMRHGVSDVTFAWDHEVNALMPASTLERLGGVFFDRSGLRVRVRSLTVAPSDDVNQTALAAASGPRPGLIWIYNRNGRTAAAAHAPRVSELDRRWRCQRIGDDMVGSLACWRN